MRFLILSDDLAQPQCTLSQLQRTTALDNFLESKDRILFIFFASIQS